MLDAAFWFLFKYPLLVFQQGDFALGVSRPLLVGLLLAAGIAAAALLTYRSIASEGSSRDKAVLVGLRLLLARSHAIHGVLGAVSARPATAASVRIVASKAIHAIPAADKRFRSR